MGFPEEPPFGVDISIPNLISSRNPRRLTAHYPYARPRVPYRGRSIFSKVQCPRFGSRFTLALAEKRLEEFDMLNDVLLHRVEANDVVQVGNFKIEFIHASHSLVDCFSLAITTPMGTVIHTGDYKIDDTPVIGKPYDLETLRRYGDKGVLALLGDSTNATVPGRTPSERDVIPAFEEIFESAEGRIFVSTFSSSMPACR